MALTILYGEAGTGKSEYCLDAMCALHKQGTSTLLLVPEQFSHMAEMALVRKNGYISDDIKVSSFKRLAHKLMEKKGLLRQNISAIGKSMLLAKAILSVSSDLTMYRRAAEKPGFISSMLEFIADCKRSAVLPENLASVTVSNNAYFSLKIKELSLLYEAYHRAVDASYTDSEDALMHLSKLAIEDDYFRGMVIFIDEFFRFTQAEMDCICAFCLAGAEVYISLGTKNAQITGVFEPVKKTAEQLLSMARQNGIEVASPVYLSEKHRFAASCELAHFEAEYHQHPPRVYEDATKDISLFIAPDLYTEVQALAAAICREVAKGNLHYRDVAVVAGNQELYRDLIKTVFPIYNIPVFIDEKKSLLSHPIIVMLFSLLDLMANGFETETILAYCKTGYSGLTQSETDTLENFALAGRLRRDDWLDETRFLQRADSIFNKTEDYEASHAEDAAYVLGLRTKLITPLLALRSALRESQRVTDRVAAFVDFFEEISLYQVVQAEVDGMQNRGDHQKARMLGEVYNLLIQLFDELVLCLGEEKIGMERLTTIISAGLSQCEISTIPPGYDQVFFGDVNRSVIKNVKALFVIGVNDTAFPAPPPQDGILHDEERRLLAEKGLRLGPDGQTIALHNQYVVYNALTISSGSLYISYAIADHEGKALRPASLIGRLNKIFPRLAVSDHIQEEPEAEQMVAGKASAWQYLLEHFHSDTPAVSALKRFFSQDAAYQNQYHALVRLADNREPKSSISEKLARALYGQGLRGSVSQLEKYSNCPFSYFMHYGLRAKERKILKIDAPDIGTLLHNLIEIASRRIETIEGGYKALDDAQATQIAREVVTEYFSEAFIARLYSEKRLAALIRRLQNQVAKMLMVIARHVAQGEFEPCAFEVAFSETGELPPVTIQLPTGETITLTGRIDRIDMMKRDASVYIKIIDYKTGNKSFKLSDVYNGLSLQLAVYLISVVEGGAALTDAKVMPAGMFYFRLADRVVDSQHQTENALLKQFKMSGLLLKDVDIVKAMDRGISGHSSILPAYMKQDGSLSDSSGSYATLEEFKKLSAHVKRTAGAIGREILHGGASVSPCKNGGRLPCTYCPYHAVCAFDPEHDRYRVMPPLRDDAVWEMLNETEKKDCNE
ncbi:MAG: hypothetical protein E7402_02110 [Ruminococcaceae bacterium]|nr:hypothetical protein [Oscillospiraceae bacterium]